MLLFIQNAFSMILSNQLRTTTYRLCCALISPVIQLVLNTTSCGGEHGVQQTNHPGLCWEPKSQTPRPEVSVCVCVNMCVVLLIFFFSSLLHWLHSPLPVP